MSPPRPNAFRKGNLSYPYVLESLKKSQGLGGDGVGLSSKEEALQNVRGMSPRHVGVVSYFLSSSHEEALNIVAPNLISNNVFCSRANPTKISICCVLVLRVKQTYSSCYPG